MKTTPKLNPPQNVTARYAAKLLRDGENKDFRIMRLFSASTMVDGVNLGQHYEAYVGSDLLADSEKGLGQTPLAAVVHALCRLGVTFRK